MRHGQILVVLHLIKGSCSALNSIWLPDVLRTNLLRQIVSQCWTPECYLKPAILKSKVYKMDIYELTDELEQNIASGARVPLTTKVVLDERQLLQILNRIRMSLPEDIEEARGILNERERIIRDAHLEAQRITAEARQEVETKIENSDIVSLSREKAKGYLDQAREKAAFLLHEAKTEAESRKAEANQYALGVLQNLDHQLSSALSSVRKGIDAVENSDKKV